MRKTVDSGEIKCSFILINRYYVPEHSFLSR
ncbi:hypothetical protein BOSE62_70331 [Bosea sp. 62]|nr:hypothetical protein BOSE7B_50166 [Bosea sp. 7B]CAD5300291.1 hypothetical protein BOSE21B_91333 [Bosea sp. 21B]CAD5300831.1 hypothetical protein BOSE46_90224 [Bosea sp. 46]VVT61992.1 hypothetical protein BOS5A_231260 [Bosea sp. EC-HK365B]VXB49282.1 hypothetical protein BOSE125_130919 [Bosea sp. 125]VXC73612.1 hypothetical protein BOSE62_70331 [Bosea sp. 62]VXC92456.1 hypothetical protein BOSE29B_81279 [Bosea sp. 29B]VXC98014.1 hypothetical protein BOSE127_90166 [Bosea sp. 127]